MVIGPLPRIPHSKRVSAMKLKLFALTALSLAGLALSAAPASAWWLQRHNGINRYSTVVVCRPYNAFTPVCRGSLVCDGCCPFSCPNIAPGACCSPVLGNPLLALAHNPANINYAAMPPMMMPPQAMMMPAPAMPQGQVPVNMQTQVPMPYPVQPAGYQQGYYPVYYPIMPSPMSINPYQQAPAYWYGN